MKTGTQTAVIVAAIAIVGILNVILSNRRDEFVSESLRDQVDRLERLAVETASSMGDLNSRIVSSASPSGGQDVVVQALPYDFSQFEESLATLIQLSSETAGVIDEVRAEILKGVDYSALEDEVQRLKLTIQETQPRATIRLPPTPDEIEQAKKSLFDTRASAENKLRILRELRSSGARDDDVARHMAELYYTLDDPRMRADIFRQLSGVTTRELKTALLDAVANDAGAEVREEAAETLADFLPDRNVQEWLEHLEANDPNEGVRRQAARSLRRIEGL